METTLNEMSDYIECNCPIGYTFEIYKKSTIIIVCFLQTNKRK